MMAAHESWLHHTKDTEVKKSVQREEDADATNLLSPNNKRALKVIIEKDETTSEMRLSDNKVYTEVNLLAMDDKEKQRQRFKWKS